MTTEERGSPKEDYFKSTVKSWATEERVQCKKKKDLQKINPLMLGSFPKQREWVESRKTKRSVKKIFKEFSGFKNYEQV